MSNLQMKPNARNKRVAQRQAEGPQRDAHALHDHRVKIQQDEVLLVEQANTIEDKRAVVIEL